MNRYDKHTNPMTGYLFSKSKREHHLTPRGSEIDSYEIYLLFFFFFL